MSTNVTLIILNLMTRLASLGVIVIGAYLLVNNHPVAGGWITAIGLISLLFGNYELESKREEKG